MKPTFSMCLLLLSMTLVQSAAAGDWTLADDGKSVSISEGTRSAWFGCTDGTFSAKYTIPWSEVELKRLIGKGAFPWMIIDDGGEGDVTVFGLADIEVFQGIGTMTTTGDHAIDMARTVKRAKNTVTIAWTERQAIIGNTYFDATVFSAKGSTDTISKLGEACGFAT